MATVELLLSPLPIHVRTARLISAAAARRAGLPADVLDELKLAVGEACSRAVAVHAQHAPEQPVQLLLRDDATGLTVEVVDRGPESGPLDDDVEQLLDDDEADPRVALAVISALVDDVSITPSTSGTSVRLRWPLPPAPAP